MHRFLQVTGREGKQSNFHTHSHISRRVAFTHIFTHFHAEHFLASKLLRKF